MLRKQEFLTEPGACYYIEIALIFINILLTVVSYLSYAKARKTNFPKQRNPYEISAESYGYVLCKHIITSTILEKAVTMTIIFVEIESPTCSRKKVPILSGIEWTNLEKRKARILSC